MAIYLHSMQDRVSHQYCGDGSFARLGPNGTSFQYNYRLNLCTNSAHALGHYEELGVADLPLRVFTALNLTYDELSAFALAMRPTYPGWFQSGAPIFDKQAMVGKIGQDSAAEFSAFEKYVPGRCTAPLTIPGALDRMNAMNTAITDAGFALMPGMTGCL